MKRPLLAFLLPLAALALFATRVAAHDGHGITIRAPLDAVDCAATPPTVTVLGLTIDISTARIDVGHDGGGEDDLTAFEHDDDGEDGGDGGNGGCAALVAGEPVQVTLASDATPLVATSVKVDGSDGSVVIAAPLQGIDATAMTVTLLGLTIDVSGATITSTDGDDDSQPVTLDQLMAGERAVVHLDPTKLPALVALALEVRNDFKVKVRAPLDAVDCAATPPTITVLGLTIDISNAVFDGGEEGDDLIASAPDEGGDHQGDDDGGDDQGDDDGGNHGAGGCAALVVGQTVQVTLASDATPLVATKVSQGEGDGVVIKAPIQAVDAGGGTVTVLGLVIDASTATTGQQGDGDDDDGATPPTPLDLTQLAPGQFAEVHLDASKLPALVATDVEVATAGGGLEVEVDDQNGHELDDPSAALTVNVTAKTRVRGSHRSAVQTLRFKASTHGSFVLSGLPAGSAKITVAGTSQGVTLARTVTARTTSNQVRSLQVRLHKVRTPH
jgi:hypothetical protein